jgi:sialate O-acetylesterase
MKFHPKSAVIKGLTFAISILGLTSSVSADVGLPNIFGNHMVLQQGLNNPVWGWADAGEAITVSIGAQTHKTIADNDGSWRIELSPMEVGPPHTLNVQGNNTITFKDVVVGEVWICSGQSNMAFALSSAYDGDLEIPTANYPNIRLISVPQVGTQEAQNNFNGRWERCSPESVGSFSAAGYIFGKQLHQRLNVPIGLIDNAWGGSAAEAWIRRDVLASDSRYGELLSKWRETERTYDQDKLTADHQKRLKSWNDNGKQGNRPRPPRNPLNGNHRPANIYNGVLHPTIGYGIKGAIWYQGESNASRAYQYRNLFPLMIQHWRDEWNQGDFPFYYVQLADFRAQVDRPQESAWAELREAQTMTMSAVANTGQAVIIDVGEGRDIHPRDKTTVGLRLARWALAQDYGIEVAHRSPEFKAIEIKGNKAIIQFDHVGKGLFSFDVNAPVGFSIAGNDRQFEWADAKIVGKNTVEVWSERIDVPVAVRYAWADNPTCTLFSREGLPATPFRTDDWPGVTTNSHK